MQILALPLLAALLLCPAPILAGDRPAQEMMTFIVPVSGFEERLSSLENRQAELYHTLEQKKEAGLAERLTERLTISGLLEVEASGGTLEYADGSSAAASDLTLATAQLGLGMTLNDAVGGNLIFLYEEGGDLEVDEAAIDLEQGAFFARVGRHYLPFGAYHSHFISDPLTLALGETRATALQLGYQPDLVTLSAFAFNGAADQAGSEDHLSDWGVSLTVTPLAGLELGSSYLSDLADSNAALLAAPYARRVAGWSAFLHLAHGPLFFEAEYLAAVQAFAAGDLDGDGDDSGDRPQAWNLECAFRPSENVELALRYGGSDEFAGQPQQQYGASVSWSPWQHTTLALEYLRGEFDQAFAGDLASSSASPADSRNLITAQLAYEF